MKSQPNLPRPAKPPIVSPAFRLGLREGVATEAPDSTCLRPRLQALRTLKIAEDLQIKTQFCFAHRSAPKSRELALEQRSHPTEVSNRDQGTAIDKCLTSYEEYEAFKGSRAPCSRAVSGSCLDLGLLFLGGACPWTSR